MISLTLLKLEQSIRYLSLPEKAWLLERIAKQIREKAETADKFGDREVLKEQLSAMANDFQIQTENLAINQEFAITETDQLDEL